MLRHKLVRCARWIAVILFLGGLVGVASKLAVVPPIVPVAVARAAETAPAPGQLAIVDKKGQVTALCPLKHTAVTADVTGFVARVEVRQQFLNPSREPIEVLYTFPLPEDAAVDDMTMTIGKRVVKGQIKRREEAREIYEAARSAGQAAALLDQERPNIFTQAVANIMPGESVVITISYVNLLKYDGGQYEFVFPMVVGPRFVPGGGYTVPGQRGDPSPAQPVETDAVPTPVPTPVVTDAEKITPPITPPKTRAGHDISLTVHLNAGFPLRDIASQLHGVNVSRQGSGRATIRLRDRDTLPNKDFILRYTVAGKEMQAGVLAHAPKAGDGYFTLILQPPVTRTQAQITPKEVIFVIDQTGSQSGLPIRKAKETMRYLIQNMNPGDSFQLLGFNMDVYPCFPAPVHNTPANVAKALRFLEPIEGSGGTDILKAVDYALKIPADTGRQRIVCYLTDGYVGNDMQILDYIKKNRGRAHMFPFGIGNSVNRLLIDGMAKEGLGIAEYVDLKAPGEEAAARFYRRISKPLLVDIKVDWHGLPVADVYPKQMPDMFLAGRPVILKGRYTKSANGEFTISGDMQGKPWSQTVRVALPAVQQKSGEAIRVALPAVQQKSGEAMPTLWAREKIEDLQSQDWMGAQTGKPQENIKEQIVAVALEYRLMSQYTSFVAVEERVVNIGGRQRKIDVPIEMPEGVSYEGIFGDGERRELRQSFLSRRFSYESRSSITGALRKSAPARTTISPSIMHRSGSAAYSPPPPSSVRPAPSAPAPASQPSAGAAGGSAVVLGRQRTQIGQGLLYEDGDGSAPRMDATQREVAEGTEAGQKRLTAMKPEERRALLSQVKLAAALRGLAEKVKKEGSGGSLNTAGLPKVEKSRVEVQIWLNALPADGLMKLKQLGFELVATLTPNKLLLGTLPVERLDALVELPFVRRVEPPRFK